MLIVSPRHLEAPLREYAGHFNGHRPHRALGMQAPAPTTRLRLAGKDPPSIHGCDVLGGVIHEYEIAARDRILGMHRIVGAHYPGAGAS
jgi:putative transposase